MCLCLYVLVCVYVNMGILDTIKKSLQSDDIDILNRKFNISFPKYLLSKGA